MSNRNSAAEGKLPSNSQERMGISGMSTALRCDSNWRCPRRMRADSVSRGQDDQEELVVFMTLPFGVEESIIPGVLASRGIPVHVSERYLARQGRYVEIQVPASRLDDARRALDEAKRVGGQLKTGNED